MVQREVADRFFARPSTKAYGAVSVLVQLAAERTGFHPVSPQVFRPRPNVDSGLVAFRRLPLPENYIGVKKVVAAAFAHRRKTLANSLGQAGLASRDEVFAALEKLEPLAQRSRRGAGTARLRRPRRRAAMSATEAPAKLNLALVVGPLRDDGKHEIVSLMAPLELADRIELDSAEELHVTGFDDDTLVRGALEALATAAGTEPRWRVTIEKQIPVAAGLGGGSSDAAAALQLANETLDEPLPGARLHELAAALGADIPFFLAPGPKLARGDGTVLEPLECPRTSSSCSSSRTAPRRARPPPSTASSTLGAAIAASRRVWPRSSRRARRELTDLPRNDLASSPHAARLEELGAFRADVTGAGPAVYGLFRDGDAAAQAAGAVARLGRVWVDKPGW